MAEYFIGMHGKFDDEKYKRDFTDMIAGIELCNFTDMQEIERAVGIARKDKFKIGIHFPMFKENYKYRDPMILALEEAERIEAFEAVEREMKLAKSIGAEYLLIHFPKPMAIRDGLNWDICNFATEAERMYDSEYPYEVFEKNCCEAFRKLSKLSEEAGIPIVLELDFLNEYVYGRSLFKELLGQYQNIKVCLDSARLYIQSVLDKEFNMDKFLVEMAPYASNIHLWNVRVTDKLEFRHYPALEGLKTQDFWGDMGHFLRLLSMEGNDYRILFEHRSDLITEEELFGCYSWVRSFFMDNEQGMEKGYKVIGEKEPGSDYFSRKAVYALAFNSEGKIAVAKTDRGLFLPGGGLEENETMKECLHREILEETGHESRIGNYVDSAILYEFSPRIKKYIKGIGHFYEVTILDKVCEKVDEDHELVWIDPEVAKESMLLEHQAWAIKRVLELKK